MSHCTAEGVIDAQPKKFDGRLCIIRNLMGQQWGRSEINRGIDPRQNSHKKGTRGPEVFGGSAYTKV